MQITTEALEAQIEVWINEKHQTVAKLNYLEGSIQSYRVLIAQMDNENEEGENDGTENNQQQAQETNGANRSKSGIDNPDVGASAGKTKSKAQAKS